MTDSARVKVVVRERRDVTDSARRKGAVGGDLVLQTVQGGKGVVRERIDFTDNAGESVRWGGT